MNLEAIARVLHAALAGAPGIGNAGEPSPVGAEELWIGSAHWEMDALTEDGELIHVVAYGPDDLQEGSSGPAAANKR